MPTEDDRPAAVLRSKRAATRYQILAEVAEHQPAVSQREIADAIGVTTQAVSEHLSALDETGLVRKRGRGRYEITNEGVDWLLSETEALKTYLAHVTEDVLEPVDLEAAIATATIEEGQQVGLSMRDGVLHASPNGADGGATAVAVTGGDAGSDIAVSEFDGVLEYEWGTVTVVSIPTVRLGGSSAIDPDALRSHMSDADLVAAAGTEAIAAVRALEGEPDLIFATEQAVQEAAVRGLDVVLVCVSTRVGDHIEILRENEISAVVVDMTE